MRLYAQHALISDKQEATLECAIGFQLSKTDEIAKQDLRAALSSQISECEKNGEKLRYNTCRIPNDIVRDSTAAPKYSPQNRQPTVRHAFGAVVQTKTERHVCRRAYFRVAPNLIAAEAGIVGMAQSAAPDSAVSILAIGQIPPKLLQEVRPGLPDTLEYRRYALENSVLKLSQHVTPTVPSRPKSCARNRDPHVVDPEKLEEQLLAELLVEPDHLMKDGMHPAQMKPLHPCKTRTRPSGPKTPRSFPT